MSDATTIARALRGKRRQDGAFLCHCPVPGHGKGKGDRNRSLLVKDGDKAPLFTCFAGCDRRDVADILRRRGLLGGDHVTGALRNVMLSAPPRAAEPDEEALAIWMVGKSPEASLIERYLRSRGLTLAIPPSLRCGECMHLGRYPMPIMIAAVQRPDGEVIAVQTTLLTGAGKKAPVSMPRLTTGALADGAVRFAEATELLGIGEGTESVLSAMQITGVPSWACLGAGRMHRVAIPDSVRELHIFGDNDEPGRAAVERTAHANRHRRVVLRYPPDGYKDYNDLLMARVRAAA
jgi:putative DNA primase/helicase